MATTEELVGVYSDQAGADADDVITLLLDFIASHGMTEGAIAALCSYLDDEGLSADFSTHLKENGLVIDTQPDASDLLG